MKLYCDTCGKPFTPELTEGAAAVPCPVCGKEIPVPEKNVVPGVVIGDFLIEKPLSHGGMGEVFVARQLSLDRPVALKVLRDKFSADKEYIDGLFREARAAAKLTHPHIVQAYAVGEEDGIYYFAMELIRGETFKQILKRENVLDFTKAAKVIREISSALDAAWKDQKLVHQDIKPDNIMLDANGFSKLADLGLARTGNEATDTDADEVLGTPQYISPEQLTGVPTDVRSDIYSLGATFYQFVTGHFPYEADTAEEMSKMHVAGNLTPPKQVNPELPDALNAIIVKMMARNIEERYQLPSEIICDLDDFLNNSMSRPINRSGLLKKPALSRPGTTPAAGLPGLKKPLTPGVKPAVPGAKPAVPGAKPLLNKPAVPGAKPAVPGIKPAVPGAKPAVPGIKPAVPGKENEETPAPAPETPPAEEPAEAASAAAETPAPPAAEPAVPPAEAPASEAPAAEEKPQEKPQEDIALAPETPRRAKKKQDGAEEKEGEAEEESGKKKPRRTKDAGEKKKSSGILKTILLLLVVLLIIGGAGAGFFFAAKADKLPAKLKPWGEKMLAKLGQKKADPKAAAPAETKPAAPENPKEPESPKTRPEYIKTLEALRSEFRNTSGSGRSKWLTKADETLRRLGKPVTEEEHDVLCKTWAMYSIADEELRFVSARAKARAAYEAAAEKRRLQKEKEEEERRNAQSGEEARKRELAEQEARIRRDQQARQAEINARYAKLKKELDALNKALIKSVVISAESKDRSSFDKALEEAKNYLVPTVCDTIAERAAIATFNAIKTCAPFALASYEKFLAEAASFEGRGTLMTRVNGRYLLVRVNGIGAKGKILYRTTKGVQGEYTPETPKEYQQLMKYLLSGTDLPGVEFHYGLMSRKLTPDVVKRLGSILSDPRTRNFWLAALRFYAASLR